jgi:hypothetical protein
MKYLACSLLIFNFFNCFDKHRSDSYQTIKEAPNRYGDLENEKIIDTLFIGKTTREEVLDTFGDTYDYKLTFVPLQKRKYSNRIYLAKYLLHYYIYNPVIQLKVSVTMFFGEDEKLLFFYLKNMDYPTKKEYHNLPKDTPEDEVSKIWPYSMCDCKYYEKVSNPFIDRFNGKVYDWIECEWEKDYPEHATRQRLLKEKKEMKKNK